MQLMHGDVTEKVIAAAFEVHRVLGHGFLEMVYQRSLQAELIRNGVQAQIARKVSVSYKGVNVGEYAPDILVEEVVIVEVKVAKQLDPRDESQLLNELKVTGIRVGLLINFGRDKVEFKRMVL